MTLTINFTNDINNTSLQIKDIAYYIPENNITSNYATGFISSDQDPIEIGQITGITNSSILVETNISTLPSGTFIMFQKDRSVNNTSLLGYYAEVKLTNNSTEKAELFALNSEITQSSK